MNRNTWTLIVKFGNTYVEVLVYELRFHVKDIGKTSIRYLLTLTIIFTY